MFTRFLFSCLADADFLDTEAFYEPQKRTVVKGGVQSLAELSRKLSAHLDELSHNAAKTAVNEVRRQVLDACRAAGRMRPGCFSLTVPTGGGKTLSAMEFALRHAEPNGLQRVIVVIPYTSIIEQNASVYRNVLGGANVLEHHSSLDPAEVTERNRLASENWDAPVIVTTSVQFFESLFANKPSRCRKLHNVARSVVILDEVQSLPAGLMLPIVEGLNELTANYGCSVVLSTATPPALAKRERFEDGLADVRQIAANAPSLSKTLNRVRVTWPKPDAPHTEWDALARELTECDQVLAIVHRRNDARHLAGLLPKEGRFHLSALMCARHRTRTLRAVRQALTDGGPCRLVSTQLVEAGVDIDFPAVYRAMGGLDSIVQGAGRCNREGAARAGQMVVFRAPTAPPGDTLRQALETTETMLREAGGEIDLTAPEIFETYFRKLYFKKNLDEKAIQAKRQELQFQQVAGAFRLIEDGYSHPIVVPYPGFRRPMSALRRDGPSRKTLRGLQRFLVNIYDRDVERLRSAAALELVHDTVLVLAEPFHHLHDREFGLVVGDNLNADTEKLVV